MELGNRKHSAEILEDIRRTFKIFDQDGDGRISTEEIGTVMRALGQNPSDEEINELVGEVDSDGNGYLEFMEFVEAMRGRFNDQETEQEDLRAAFEIFDRDGNGYIDSKEIQRVVSNLGSPMTVEEISEVMKVADNNNDGQIDYNEFVKVICHRS